MDQNNAQKAKCLCGSVKITAAEVNPQFTVCHCDDCRTWGSGPFFAVQCGTEVSFEGAQHISEYESSAWASRAFVPTVVPIYIIVLRKIRATICLLDYFLRCKTWQWICSTFLINGLIIIVSRIRAKR